MTQPEIAATPAIPLDADGPVFQAPWEAQAFGMALALHERGYFAWSDFVRYLSAEIAAHADEQDGSHYYQHWLAALEKLVAEQGLVAAHELSRRRAAWDRAARATPHGQPIVLPTTAAD
jgi:nitrile hydratase accessory protein